MKQLWHSRSERERRIVKTGVAMAIALSAWSFAWVPLTASRVSLRTEAVANAADLAWMHPASLQLRGLGAAPPAPSQDGISLLARVDQGARASGLGASLVNVEPVDRHRIRIQVSGADFDTLITWLEQSTASGLRIEELSVQRASGAGRVDARIAFRDDSP